MNNKFPLKKIWHPYVYPRYPPIPPNIGQNPTPIMWFRSKTQIRSFAMLFHIYSVTNLHY